MHSERGKAIPFIDVQSQHRRLREEIEGAIGHVLEHGRFIMGPEVLELEEELAAYVGSKHCVSCASGTDALLMPLMAWEVGPGDAVFVPAFTFAATAEVVVLAGATPVFVDVLPSTFNLDPSSLADAIEHVTSDTHLSPAAAIAVDLFGQPADYAAIRDVTTDSDLKLIADSAQSFGASVTGRQAVTLGDVGATSFFPAKPLGCYGDGGAVFTDSDEVADALRSIRVHGQGDDKYDNVRIGINGRLDTIQAAVLLQKLKVFDEELEMRSKVAARYADGLSDVVVVPQLESAMTSAWAQYTVLCERRDEVAAHLRDAGIPTAVYYPKALSRQKAYEGFPRVSQGTPVSEDLATRVLSLPMHPYLDTDTQDFIIATFREAIATRG